jgi:hypothetical protein
MTRSLESSFVWFISAADSALLQSDFGMSQPPALGRVLLDNAIILSQNAGLEGRIGLHAATTVKLPPGVKRKNDGRFFFPDETQAEAMAAMLDPSR